MQQYNTGRRVTAGDGGHVESWQTAAAQAQGVCNEKGVSIGPCQMPAGFVGKHALQCTSSTSNSMSTSACVSLSLYFPISVWMRVEASSVDLQ